MRIADRRWTLGHAAAINGVGRQCVAEWHRWILFLCCNGGEGRRAWRRVDFVGLVVIAVIAELRRRGVSRAAISPITCWLCHVEVWRLLKYESIGRTLLVSAGKWAKIVHPENRPAMGASGAELAVDLGPIIATIREKIEATAGQSRQHALAHKGTRQ